MRSIRIRSDMLSSQCASRCGKSGRLKAMALAMDGQCQCTPSVRNQSRRQGAATTARLSSRPQNKPITPSEVNATSASELSVNSALAPVSMATKDFERSAAAQMAFGTSVSTDKNEIQIVSSPYGTKAKSENAAGTIQGPSRVKRMLSAAAHAATKLKIEP
jgi:hypothetical protein